MESDRFDGLTRQLSRAGSSRRQALRALGSVLLGGALGGVAARLGFAAGAEARTKTKRGKPNLKRKRQTERKGHGQLQAAGKHKRNKHHHHHNPPQDLPPLPPGCASCNACQMCQDGACVADPALGGVPCEGSGAGCNHCLEGQCVPTEQPPCDDGTCAHRGQCCPGEQYCRDPLSPLGYSCLGPDDCCPGTKKCAGTCIPNESCCEDSPLPLCSDYCSRLGCVHGEWKCVPLPDGTTCLRSSGPDGKCCQGVCSMEEIICPAYPWRHYNPETCRCECNDGLVDCPGGYQDRPCCEPV